LEFKAPNPALVNLSVSGALDFKQHLATGSSSERAENSSERAGWSPSGPESRCQA